MPITRQTGLNVSIFNIDGTAYLADLDNATLSLNIESEDARGIADEWSYAWATSKSWSIEAETFVASDAAILADAAAGDSLVTVAFDTGAGAYSGTALIKSASHSASRGALQKQKFSLEGQGTLTVA